MKRARLFESKDLIIAILIAIIIIGTIFKIQHWPFERELNFISIISIGLISFFTGLNHFLTSNRSNLDSIGHLIVLLLTSIQLNKLILFTKMIGLSNLLFLLTLIWILISTIFLIRRKIKLQIAKGQIIILSGIGCLIGEIVLRTKHLPMAGILSILGLLLIMIGLIIRFSTEKHTTKTK